MCIYVETLEKTERSVKNGRSTDKGNIGDKTQNGDKQNKNKNTTEIAKRMSNTNTTKPTGVKPSALEG